MQNGHKETETHVETGNDLRTHNTDTNSVLLLWRREDARCLLEDRKQAVEGRDVFTKCFRVF